MKKGTVNRLRVLQRIGMFLHPVYTAVDLGAGAIKVVQVRRSTAGLSLTGAGSVSVSRNVMEPGSELVTAVRQAREQANLAPGQVVVSLPARHTIIRQLKLPAMPRQDLDRAIRWEAGKTLPVALDGLILRYIILGGVQHNGVKTVNILLAAAQEDIIRSYRELLLEAGLVIKAIDIHALALWRVLVLNHRGRGHEGPCRVVLDIGATTTQILVVQRDELKHVWSLSVGVGCVQSVNEPKNIDPVARMEEVAGEVKRTLMYFRNQRTGDLVEQVIVTGGGARVDGICPLLGESLGLPVELGLPEVALINKDGPPAAHDPAFSVALGLALWEVVSDGKN